MFEEQSEFEKRVNATISDLRGQIQNVLDEVNQCKKKHRKLKHRVRVEKEETEKEVGYVKEGAVQIRDSLRVIERVLAL